MRKLHLDGEFFDPKVFIKGKNYFVSYAGEQENNIKPIFGNALMKNIKEPKSIREMEEYISSITNSSATIIYYNEIR